MSWQGGRILQAAHLHPELASHDAKQRVVRLLEEVEHDRLVRGHGGSDGRHAV